LNQGRRIAYIHGAKPLGLSRGNKVAGIQEATEEQDERESEKYYELVTHNALLIKFEETKKLFSSRFERTRATRQIAD
jgi:hypothetical protein